MNSNTERALAFIGAGNMASSMFGGLIKNGIDPTMIRVSDPDSLQRAKASKLGIQTFKKNSDCVREAGFIIICVKPQLAKTVCKTLELSNNQVLISIAAGISLLSLENWLPGNQPIIRGMPNTPALIQQGITALYANDYTKQAQRTEAEKILSAIVETLWVDHEEKIDVVTAVSGSGPAYFFYLMEHMIEAGKELGISEKEAIQLTIQTALGSAKLASMNRSDHPRLLRQSVTSPGGTTQRAIETFEAHKLNEIIKLGIKNARNRSSDLSLEFGESSE